MTAKRRRSRARLLEVLYQYHLSGQWPALAELDTHFADDSPARDEDASFTAELHAALQARIDEVDQIIESASRNWRLDRMAAVDLSLLRLATMELLLETAPPRVVLNEAVELAKTYGTDTSSGFVNGVLDGVLRQRQ